MREQQLWTASVIKSGVLLFVTSYFKYSFTTHELFIHLKGSKQRSYNNIYIFFK
jgi:hypothetical protein